MRTPVLFLLLCLSVSLSSQEEITPANHGNESQVHDGKSGFAHLESVLMIDSLVKAGLIFSDVIGKLPRCFFVCLLPSLRSYRYSISLPSSLLPSQSPSLSPSFPLSPSLLPHSSLSPLSLSLLLSRYPSLPLSCSLSISLFFSHSPSLYLPACLPSYIPSPLPLHFLFTNLNHLHVFLHF